MRDVERGMWRIGVHTSIAGGIHLGLRRALGLGCTTVQIFSHNPRGWALREMHEDEVAEFKRIRAETDISPVYVHAAYLINIASASKELREKSAGLLSEEMKRASALGAEFVVLHPGSARDRAGRKRAAASLREVLHGKGYGTGLLIENTSGKRGDVAPSMANMAEIMDEADGLPAGVCIDTCHAFSAGYDISGERGLEKLVFEIDRHIGLDRVKVVHLNDSKGGPGSGLDRHEHIGRGKIGAKALGRFMNHPAFRGVPVILETPKKSDDDDRRNLETARGLFSGEAGEEKADGIVY